MKAKAKSDLTTCDTTPVQGKKLTEPNSTLEERSGGDPMFQKFLEDSEMEDDGQAYEAFESSKVTKVLKVFLSKS